MQLHSFERRNSYIFFPILNQTHELFFAPPGIFAEQLKIQVIVFFGLLCKRLPV